MTRPVKTCKYYNACGSGDNCWSCKESPKNKRKQKKMNYSECFKILEINKEEFDKNNIGKEPNLYNFALKDLASRA
jgi:hypothetical protein